MKPQIHIGEEIKKHLAAQKRSVAWLAEEVCYEPSSLRKLLKKSHISTELLYSISDVLDQDFFERYTRLLAENRNNRQIIPENQANLAR